MRAGGRIAAAALGAVVLVVVLVGAAGAGVAQMLGLGPASPSAGAVSAIPPEWLALYQRAATSCPGLPWAVVAAIGTVESDNGASTAPGVTSGANAAGAEGPMQFEPATFAAYAQPVPDGGASPPSPYDPTDAVYAAVRDLCANGAANGADIPAAVFAYNHDENYVAEVLSIAQSYEAPVIVAPSGAASVAVNFALAQLGTPYVWGGSGPGGFDCSGLVWAAYGAAGVSLPRGAQDQYDATAHLSPGDALQPGDLVFFGSGPGAIEHVGIYVGNGDMVDAPHSGAAVRVEPYRWDNYLAATRPAP